MSASLTSIRYSPIADVIACQEKVKQLTRERNILKKFYTQGYKLQGNAVWFWLNLTPADSN